MKKLLLIGATLFLLTTLALAKTYPYPEPDCSYEFIKVDLYDEWGNYIGSYIPYSVMYPCMDNCCYFWVCDYEEAVLLPCGGSLFYCAELEVCTYRHEERCSFSCDDTCEEIWL